MLSGHDADTWHIITCEYPPQTGGVSDHSFAIAQALAATGRTVHVWCPETENGNPLPRERVTVHRELGRFAPADLRRAGRMLDAYSESKHVLVQWVPHGYGYRSLNVAFARWVADLGRRTNDELDLVVHEPYLAWSLHPIHLAGALVHRLMLVIAAFNAKRLWVTIPAWAHAVRGYVTSRTPVRWLPVPSPFPVTHDDDAVNAMRHAIVTNGQSLVGHFGSYSPLVTRLLAPALDCVLERESVRVVLMGHGGRAFADDFLSHRPQFAGRVVATGRLDAAALSLQIQTCDAMLQPYPDGVSSRRTTMVALLAHGKAIVTNDGDLTDDVWRTSGAVTLVSSPDPVALGDAMRALLDDRKQQTRLCDAATRLYDRLFDVRHAIAAMTALNALGSPAVEEVVAQ